MSSQIPLHVAFEKLGLDPSVKYTDDEIKTRYRQLLLQSHPDKNKNCNHDRFIEIKKAYDVIKIGVFETPDTEDDDNIWFKLFDMIVSKLNSKLDENTKKSVCDVQIHYDVTLEEVYKGVTKRFVVNVRNSHQFIVGKEMFFISMKNFKANHYFQGKGDLRDDGTRTDVNIVLNLQEHDHVHVDKIIFPYDLSIEFDISLNEYYNRKELIFMLFDTIIEVPYSQGTRVKVIKGKGLPYFDDGDCEKRGDLYVYFNLKLPTYPELPSDLKQCLSIYFMKNE